MKPLAHDSFLEHIVQYLQNESMGNATTKVIRKRPAETSTSCQFEGNHYPVHIPKCSELKTIGHAISLKRKLTFYQCNVCKISLCIELCFKTYHKLGNYKRSLLDY